ncbi:hypothetical protein ACIBHY_09500, partial [Nonomuraea sp. NPDC050547]|uniref:hypothetical protein n=1 Tax=Nonomuraea sp. NPDC050547 TaxID=3364368 RepID=UPI00379D973F
GNVFKFVGGAPIHLTTCSVGCGNPVPITAWSVRELEHMRPHPHDGATARDEAGNVFKFAGGAPIRLANCSAECGDPVPISAGSVVRLDHMLPQPKDGTTVQDETLRVFKFAGGAPLQLADCTVGCGHYVRVTAWSVDARDHMLERPVEGTLLQAADAGNGTVYLMVGGQADVSDRCPGAPECGRAVPVNQHSVEVLADPISNRGPAYGQLTRYRGPTGEVRSSSGSVPPGYRFVGAFGHLSPVHVPGTRPLYSCQTGADQFSSLREDCGGEGRLGVLGWIHTDRPAGRPSAALFRCVDNRTGDHFDSHSPECEGQRVDGPLGYLAAYASLTRYVQTSKPGEHRSAAQGMPSGYSPEQGLGLISMIQVDGTALLFSCRIGDEAFTSRDPGCEGHTTIGPMGWVWTAKPADTPVVALHRCVVAATGEHFDSRDSGCEGHRVDGLLGYIHAYLPLARSTRGPDHRASTGALPPGYLLEATIGYVTALEEAGTRPLLSCLDDTEEFVSVRPDCEGKVVIGLLGHLWVDPPPSGAAVAVYRCNVADNGDHFISVRPDCEGHAVDGMLGYARGSL